MNLDVKEKLEALILDVPNFPKEGIMFKDITPLLAEPGAISEVATQMASAFEGKNINYVAGLEARGFIIGPSVANILNAGFIPIRKSGKLPRATLKATYQLEYGTETLEIHKNSIDKDKNNILIVDDVLATGGTARAASDLVMQCGGNIVGYSFLIELQNLNGKKLLNSAKANSLFVF